MSSTGRVGWTSVRGARRRWRSSSATSPRASRRRSAGSRPVARIGSASSSARWLSVSLSPSSGAPVRNAHGSVRGLPFGGSTSCSARAGVEQYSSAIQQAQLDEILRDAVLAHGRRRDEPLGRELGVLGQPDHDPVERLAAERDPHDRADPHGLLRQRVVERPAQAARRGEGLDPGDHGLADDRRAGGRAPRPTSALTADGPAPREVGRARSRLTRVPIRP